MKATKEFISSLPKVVDPDSGCWLYLGYCLRGYGILCIDYKDYPIHRLSAVAYLGLDYYDYNLEACHKPFCRNKSCFNPEHLYIGTHRQNMGDIVISRTHASYKKEVCPKCGGEYTKFTSKSGDRKGQTQRRCYSCYNKKRAKKGARS